MRRWRARRARDLEGRTCGRWSIATRPGSLARRYRAHMSGSRWSADAPKGAEYDARWAALEARGRSVHGEADFVSSYHPETVLDAGCGTGRVAIELAARGIDVVGVDLDEPMLAEARRKAPQLDWRRGDLANVVLDRRFDVVVMAGNVMIFVTPGTEHAVVDNMASHLRDGGALVSGF